MRGAAANSPQNPRTKAKKGSTESLRATKAQSRKPRESASSDVEQQQQQRWQQQQQQRMFVQPQALMPSTFIFSLFGGFLVQHLRWLCAAFGVVCVRLWARADDSDDENEVKEKYARTFLAKVTGDKRFRHRANTLQSLLGDGVVLCQLLNRMKRGTVPKISPSSSMRFVLIVCAAHHHDIRCPAKDAQRKKSTQSKK